jgi:hypothetical protein
MFKELWRRMPRVAAAISSSTSIFAAAAFSPAARTITSSSTFAATAAAAIARSEPAATALAFPAAAAFTASALAITAASFHLCPTPSFFATAAAAGPPCCEHCQRNHILFRVWLELDRATAFATRVLCLLL